MNSVKKSVDCTEKNLTIEEKIERLTVEDKEYLHGYIDHMLKGLAEEGCQSGDRTK